MTELSVVIPAVGPGSAAPDLSAWRSSSWGGPLIAIALLFGAWVAVLAVGVWSPHWWLRLALVVPLTARSGQLFTLGHDAAHGSFSTSRTLNAVAGRLAFLPSVHVFGLWRFHHDVHHRFTNLRGHDFVWTPLTVAEYSALPRRRRWLHRLERHHSGLGLGWHYAIEIWAPRMLWPRQHQEVPHRRRIFIDALVLYGLLAGIGVVAWVLVEAVDPARAGDVGSWISAAVFLFVLPLIGTQLLIGFVIYLNHTHPDVVWYDDIEEWARHDVQLEGSVGQRFPGLRHALLPRRIMNHTAHHVDPGVPLGALAAAQRELVDACGNRIIRWDWSSQRFRAILAGCKLYDYHAHRWLTYEDAERKW